MATVRYQYAAFDFDGTLMNTMQGITKSVQYALREEFGIDVPDASELSKFCGPPFAESFKEYYGFDEAQTARAITRYRERYTTVGIFETTPFEGLRDGLLRLKENGVKLSVASSKPIYMITRLLARYELNEMFDAVLGVSGAVKDDLTKTECIELSLERLGCDDKSKACMVGDRYVDAVGAENAGVDFIAAAYGGADLAEFDRYDVKRFSDSFTDVVDYILGQE